MKLPVLSGVTVNWFLNPGITWRLNSKSTTQKLWITSTEVRLNRTVSCSGITSSGRCWVADFGSHISPVCVTCLKAALGLVTLYCGYWNSQVHCSPMTLTVTSGCFGLASM